MSVLVHQSPNVPFPWVRCDVCTAKLALFGEPAEMKAQAKAFELAHASCGKKAA